MSLLTDLATRSAAEAQGDFAEALFRFVEASEALPGADSVAFFRELALVPEGSPALMAAASAAFAQSRGNIETTKAMMTERLDARENPTFTADVNREVQWVVREIAIPRMQAVVHEACEAFKRGGSEEP